jgi:hypothetical protein
MSDLERAAESQKTARVDVRVIARRVARLEDRLVPQEDPEAKRLVGQRRNAPKAS